MDAAEQPGAGRHSQAPLALPRLHLAGPERGEARGERRDAAANREQILAIARALFAERGVDCVTMEEIAAAAGVGKGTLYRRYPHKGALALALLGANALRFAAEMDQRVERGGDDALGLIAAFLERLAAFNEENAALLGAADDAALGPRRGWLYTTPIYQWMRASLQTLLAHALARGELRPLNPAVAADVLLAPFAIDLYQYQRQELGLARDELLATARAVLLDGLRSR